MPDNIIVNVPWGISPEEPAGSAAPRAGRMIENTTRPERVLMVAVAQGDVDETERSLSELAELIRTAGGEAVDSVIQAREKIHPGTYVGTGKLEEVADAVTALDIDTVICDDELSPAQYNNLSDALAAKVMDRTMLILDIFAARARTAEGKIQVELAQLRYRSARLIGLGKSLSRLGGGIGTRGPGEKKLEMDRRLIGKRISILKKELEEVRRHRDLIRGRRREGGAKVAAIVGYTNAGKSTLLNHLTGAGVLEEDALFATLDPTTRSLTLPGGNEILLTDTVGFIHKLPHHLIEAFRSTLEEAANADLILHVVDASNPEMDHQMAVVYETLDELGAGGKTVYTLFNKTDRLTDTDLSDDIHLTDRRAERCWRISARTGEGLEELLKGLEDYLMSGQILFEGVIPYAQGGLTARIRAEGTLLNESYEAEGIFVKAMLPAALYGQVTAELARGSR